MDTDRRFALIVASYEYEDETLRDLVAPSRDAEALAEVLADPEIGGFDVRMLLNEPHDTVRQAIEEFFGDRQAHDLALLYFSGHGIKDDDGRLYLATRDTNHDRPRASAVEGYFVRDIMLGSRSKRQILTLDCCYSGAFSQGMSAKSGSRVGSAEQFKERGRIVLTASDALQYAYEKGGTVTEGEGECSIFTSVFVEGLRTGAADEDGDGSITVNELYQFVFDNVRAKSPKQTPSMSAWEAQGELVIARNPFAEATPADLPSSLSRALASDDVIERLGAVVTLEDLLGSDDPRIELAARMALTERALRPGDDSNRIRLKAAEILSRNPESPPRIVVQPNVSVLRLVYGETTPLVVHVTNEGKSPQRLRVSVSGLPASWIAGNDAELILRRGERQAVTVNIRIPDAEEDAGGQKQVIVAARSARNPSASAQTELTVVLPPAPDRDGVDTTSRESQDHALPKTFTRSQRHPRPRDWAMWRGIVAAIIGVSLVAGLWAILGQASSGDDDTSPTATVTQPATNVVGTGAEDQATETESEPTPTRGSRQSTPDDVPTPDPGPPENPIPVSLDVNEFTGGSPGSIRWTPADADLFSVADDALYVTIPGGNREYFWARSSAVSNVEDGVVSARIHLDGNDSGGVLGRAKFDTEGNLVNVYGCLIRGSPTARGFGCYRREDFGDFEMLESSDSDAVILNGVNEVEMRLLGDRLEFWINGQPVFEWTDTDPLGPGYWGAYLQRYDGSEGSHITYDRIEIYEYRQP